MYCLQKDTVYGFFNIDTPFPYYVNEGFDFEKNLYFIRFKMSGRKFNSFSKLESGLLKYNIFLNF